jgi:Flp pilus assembly protein TadB
MPAPSSTPWTGGYQSRRRGPHNPGMRVSDADRNAVADMLSKHYGDGRLNQAEFEERLQQAMNAKTQSDFAGLFDDLPDLADPDAPPTTPKPPRVPRQRGSGSPVIRLGFFAAMIVVAVVALTHIITHSLWIWLVLAVVAVLWLRDNRRRP